MTAVSIKEAKAKLSELIHKLKPGDEVIITEKNVPVARLLSAATPAAQRKLGSLQGTVKYMAPDFDAPLAIKGLRVRVLQCNILIYIERLEAWNWLELMSGKPFRSFLLKPNY